MFEVPSFESPEKENEALLNDDLTEVSTSEVLMSNISDGFDSSLPGIAWNQFRENQAAGNDNKRNQGLNARQLMDGGALPVDNSIKTYTEDEWRKSEHFRNGITFKDGWSRGRAEYLAKTFDEREADKYVMNKSKGFFQGTVGFTGQFLGSAIDPINLIPFTRAAGASAKIGTKLAKGAIEGAAGNLATAALARPYWDERGTESNWLDYASDTAIGGLFGSGFAGLGHAWGKWREKSIPQASQKTMLDAADSIKEGLENGGVHEMDYSAINEGFKESAKIDYEVRNQRVNLIKDEVAKITGDAEYAAKSAHTIDAFAETMALEMDMTPEQFMDEFGFGVQASEVIGNGKAQRFAQRPVGEAQIEVSKMIDAEIDNMKAEIEGSQAGEKLFIDGEFKGSTQSTFPQWFKDAGFESKEEFLTALKNKTTKYDTLKEFAEGRLKAAKDPEYVALTGYGLEDVPTNEMGEPLFQFAGPKAKNAPMDKLTQALIMERDGSVMDSIRENTGWFKAEDGKWRFEIDDSKASFKGIDVNRKKKFKLGDVLDHADLFEAYPEFKDINVEFAAFKGRKGGHFDAKTNTIKVMVRQDIKYPKSYHDAVEHLKILKESPEYLELQAARQVRDFEKYRKILNDTEFGRDYQLTSADVTLAKPTKTYPRDLNIEKEAFDTILHEIQHSIQTAEGFARGGNKVLDGGFNNYQRLHGEIEARNTEARKLLTPEERLKTRPDAQGNQKAIIKWKGEEIVQDLPMIPEDIEFKADNNGQLAFFKKSNGQVKGAYTPSNGMEVNGVKIPDMIHLFANADKSTFLHETAHWKLETMKRIIDTGRASDRIKNDYDLIVKWAMDQKKIDPKKNVQIHEAFAQGYELYLREGKAPTRELQGAFERFSSWLKNIYARATDLDVKLNDEIQGVYDRLFQNENQRMRELEADLAPKKPSFDLEAISKASSDNTASDVYDSFIESKKNFLMGGEFEELNQAIAPVLREKKEAETILSYFQGTKTPEEAADELGLSDNAFNTLLIDFDKKMKEKYGDPFEIPDLAQKHISELDANVIKEKKKLYQSLVARERAVSQINSIVKDANTFGIKVFDITNVTKGDTRRNATIEDGILAMIEGNNSLRGVKDAGNSIASNTQGLYNSIVGELNRGINDLSTKFDIDLFKYYENSLDKKTPPVHGDLKFHDLVWLEMASLRSDGTFKDITGIDPKVRNSIEFKQAQEMGRLLSDIAVKYRDVANNLGADIGHYEGWTPRSHDVEKIAGRKAEWKSFMQKNLNIKRTFGTDSLSASEIDHALEVLYAEATTGIRGELDLSTMVKNLPSNLAKKISQARELHFVDAMSELKYAKDFGSTSNIVEAMNGHYGSRARQISLLEKLGPNPESTLRGIARHFREQHKMKDTPQARDLIKALDEDGIISRKSPIGSALMYAMGNSSENTNMMKYGANIRAWNSLTMLGSSTLSQTTDFVHVANEKRMLEGGNTLSAWIDTFKEYATKNKDAQEVAGYLGVMVDGMLADSMNRFDVANDFKTNVDGLNNKLFKIIGVDWHTKKLKKGAVTMYAKEMADNIDRPWVKIHPQMRERLIQYGGMDQQKWDFFRRLDPIEFGESKIFSPDSIDKLDLSEFEEFIPKDYQGKPGFVDSFVPEALKIWEDNKRFELQKAKTSLSNSLRSYFYESVKNNVLEPDARTKRLMYRGYKAGTPAGEALRLISQFKTFTYLYMDRSLGGQRYKTDKNDSFGAYQFMASTLVLGGLAAALKDLAKGQEPKDPRLAQTWIQAAAQSGGAGIMGDFLQGAMGRTGATFVETFAGPTLSRVGSIATVGGKALNQVYKSASGEDADYKGLLSDSIDQGKRLIPFNNVFYTRAMADFLVWNNIKEALEPGSIRRNEKRLKKEFNQKYIMSPREFIWMK